MSLDAALLGHYAATTPRKLPVSSAQTHLQRVQAFATLFWRLNESSGGNFNEGVSGTLDFSADAAAQAALEYASGFTLAQDDTTGSPGVLGFKTHGSGGATVLTRATNVAFDVTAGGWGCQVQVDDLSDKHVLIAREEGAAADGNFSLEILAGGAVRSWRRTGGALKDISSPAGTITIGQAHWIWTDFGTAGLRIWVDGGTNPVAAEGTATGSWVTNTTSGIRVGRWVSGVSGLDGLMGWLVFRNSQPSAAEIAALARTQNVRLFTGTNLGSVADGSSIVFSARDHGHFNSSITVNEVSNGPNVDITVSGEDVTVTGVDVDAAETFDIDVTHDAGTTPDATFTIQVTAASGEFVLTDGVDFDATGTPSQVTSILNQAIADASAGASGSSSTRGAVQLKQSTTYILTCANGATNDPAGCLVMNASLPDVEIRTIGLPTGNTRAILKFDSWLGKTNCHNRALVLFDGADNCRLRNVRLDGNKMSVGTDSDLEAELYSVIDPTQLNNGGLNNIAEQGSTNCRLEFVESYDALVDGLYIDRIDGGARTESFLATDCDFHHNRRQGLTIVTAGNSPSSYDQIRFLRCKFRHTGDETRGGVVCWGQKPGFGVDIEPNNSSDLLFGITFEDCDFEDNQGSTIQQNPVVERKESPSHGRGLQLDMKNFTFTHFKVINCRFNRNRNHAFYLLTRDGGDVDTVIISDNVYGSGADANGVQTIFFDEKVGDSGGKFTNITMENNNVPTILFSTELDATGHSVTIDKGSFNPTVTTNGRATITVN